MKGYKTISALDEFDLGDKSCTEASLIPNKAHGPMAKH
jgi:hypothetical protein